MKPGAGPGASTSQERPPPSRSALGPQRPAAAKGQPCRRRTSSQGSSSCSSDGVAGRHFTLSITPSDPVARAETAPASEKRSRGASPLFHVNDASPAHPPVPKGSSPFTTGTIRRNVTKAPTRKPSHALGDPNQVAAARPVASCASATSLLSAPRPNPPRNATGNRIHRGHPPAAATTNQYPASRQQGQSDTAITLAVPKPYRRTRVRTTLSKRAPAVSGESLGASPQQPPSSQSSISNGNRRPTLAHGASAKMTTRTASDIAAKAAENVTSISAKRSSGKKTAKGGRSDHPLAPDAFGDKDTIHDFDREDTATEVIRETQSLSLMETFELPSNPKAALIADEFVWIALQNGWAEVRDRATGTLIAGCRTRPDQQRQPSSAAIITCMFHDDSGGKVWIGSSDGTLQAWKRDGSARVGDPFQAHHGAVRCVTGRDVLWTAGDDWSIVQRTMTGQAKMVVSNGMTWVKCMVVSREGHLWAGTEEGVRVWSASGAHKGLLRNGHKGAVTSICLGGNAQQHVWTASADGSICVWRSADGVLLQRHEDAHDQWVYMIRPVGRDLWSADLAGVLGVWDQATGKLRKRERPKERRHLVDIATTTSRVWLVYRDPPNAKMLNLDHAAAPLRRDSRPLSYVEGHPGIVDAKPASRTMEMLHHGTGAVPVSKSRCRVRPSSPWQDTESDVESGTSGDTSEFTGRGPGSDLFDDFRNEGQRPSVQRQAKMPLVPTVNAYSGHDGRNGKEGNTADVIPRAKVAVDELGVQTEASSSEMELGRRLRDAVLAQRAAEFQMETASKYADQLFADLEDARVRIASTEDHDRRCQQAISTLATATSTIVDVLATTDRSPLTTLPNGDATRDALVDEVAFWQRKFADLAAQQDVVPEPIQLPVDDKALRARYESTRATLSRVREQVRVRIARDHVLWALVGATQSYVVDMERQLATATAERDELQKARPASPVDEARRLSGLVERVHQRIRQQRPPALQRMLELNAGNVHDY